MLEWREAAGPLPSEGEVLIDVVAVPVLHLDTQIRSGWGRQFGITPPYVPGTGYVGRVVEAGPGAEPSWTGRMVAVDTGAAGGCTERAVAEADRLIQVPDGVGPAETAALLHDGRTALGLCEAVPVHAGDRVLVLGAAGGLGLLLVQLARIAGAHVVAAARGAKKLDLASEVGAHATVDYSDPGWRGHARAVSGGGHGFDVVFDGVGGALGTVAFDLVASGGRFSAHGAPSGGFAAVDADVARRAASHTPASRRRSTPRLTSAG